MDNSVSQNSQSSRVALRAKVASNVRSSFFAVSKSMCCCDLINKYHNVTSGFTYLEHVRVSYDSLELNGIDKRFTESDILDTRVVKAIDVLPD